MWNNILFGVIFILFLNFYIPIALSANTLVTSSSAIGTRYTINVAIYAKEEEARINALGLKNKGFLAFLFQNGKYYSLCVGNFKSKESALELKQKLPGKYRNDGYVVKF